MKALAIFSVLMTVALFTMMPATGFAANEDPLFCLCVPVDDDGTTLADIEAKCADYSSTEGYARWRVRPPQKGEEFREIFVTPPFPCNQSINGTVVCQGGTLETLAEPLACAGAPSQL